MVYKNTTGEITTNNIPVPMVPYNQLPKRVREEFDAVSAKDSCFVKRYKNWYDVSDFMPVDGLPGGFHAALSQSWSDAVVIMVTDDNEVVLGHYCDKGGF